MSNINRRAAIGPGLALPHPTCIFIGPYASIGRDCRLGTRIFIACKFHPEDPSDYPVISDGVSLAVGTVVLGGVCIGEAVVIGPNTVVMKDIPDFFNVPPPPARGVLRAKDEWD
jgi:serine acetyltransferase